MSTLAMRSSSGASARREELDEICPVCKSSKYLDRSIRFLVNPECYHKMCQSCVDRLFSHGPAMCPIHGCGRTLRKARFREQRFEDLKIEKEVDVRKRIADIFSKTEEEFETLDDYNNYLEEMETITFNLLNRIDVAESEAKLRAYAAQAVGDDSNDQATTTNDGPLVSTPSAGLTPSFSGAVVAAPSASQNLQLKRSSARTDRLKPRTNAALSDYASTPTSGASTPLQDYHLKGLRRHPAASALAAAAAADAAAANKPFSPFGGLRLKPEHYILQQHYEHPWLDGARTDPQITAGGYSVAEYYQRAMFDAFSGMAVFIDEEVKERPLGIQHGLMGLSLADSDGGDTKMS